MTENESPLSETGGQKAGDAISEADSVSYRVETEDMASLKEIYTHIHKEMMDLRTLVTQITSVYSGACGFVIGWMANKTPSLPLPLSISIFMVSLTTGIFLHYFVNLLDEQFNEKASVINKIEKVFGAFKEGRFGLKKDEMLFPKHWIDFGNPKIWK